MSHLLKNPMNSLNNHATNPIAIKICKGTNLQSQAKLYFGAPYVMFAKVKGVIHYCGKERGKEIVFLIFTFP